MAFQLREERVPVNQEVSDFVLDRASILDRLDGDEEILAMMAGVFIDDVENNCQALEKAAADRDAVSLQRMAHTIKGLLATFSDDAGAAVAQGVERQARAGEIAGESAIAMLQKRLRDVARALQD